MNKTRFALKALTFLVVTLACASAAHAQATRTWVSGVNWPSGKGLYVENCEIFGFKASTAQGIRVNLVLDGGQLFVRDSIVADCASDGINVTTSVGQVKINLDGVHVDRCAVGVHVVNNASRYINHRR